MDSDKCPSLPGKYRISEVISTGRHDHAPLEVTYDTTIHGDNRVLSPDPREENQP